MLVPMIALAVLGWLIVNDNLDGASRYDAFSEQAGLANALATVADQLQSERDQVLMYNASNRSDGAAVDSDQAQQVDSSVDYFRGELSSASGLDPGFASALHSASTALNGRGALRQAAGGDHETDQALLGGYDKLLDTSLRAIRLAPLVTGGDTTLYRQASSLDALRQAKEQYTRGNAIMLAAAEHGSITSSQLDALNAAQSSYSTQIGIFTANASQADQRAYASAQSSADFTERGRLRQQLLSAGDGGSVDVSPAAIQHSGEAAAASLSKVEQNLDQELLSAASGGYSASKRAAVFTTIVIAAILALACLIAVLMIRALIESVHRLRDDTLDVANTRLPESVRKVFAADDPIAVANEPIIEPVGVSSTDEIGDVARNVDAVHSKATELAAEHAARHGDLNAVLVNVSRRGQALVERQLGLIDQLETGEVDPQQLANLYELDRLATRMRRNSENLLVLSGNGLGKQQPAPVSISELLTAAVGEVEQYSRIRVDVPVECAVLGEVVNDLLHLLAELMENATGHSDGRSTVLVRTRLTRDGELSVKIIDNGIGMSEDNLREANRRLAEPAPARVQPSTTMGLDVVAKLAKPHGITVDLRPNVPQPYVGQPNVGQPNVRRPKAGRGDGLVATVLVPAALVADAAQAMTIVLPIDPAQYGGGAVEGTAAASTFPSAPMPAAPARPARPAQPALPEQAEPTRPLLPPARRTQGPAPTPAPTPTPLSSPSETEPTPIAARLGGPTDRPLPLEISGPALSRNAIDAEAELGTVPAPEVMGSNAGNSGERKETHDWFVESLDKPSTTITPRQPITISDHGASVEHHVASVEHDEPAPLWPTADPIDPIKSIEPNADSGVLDSNATGRETHIAAPVNGQPKHKEPALEVDAPTARLPIFEKVLSQWFTIAERPNDQPPAHQPDDGTPAHGRAPERDADGTGAMPVNRGRHADTERRSTTDWATPADDGWRAAAKIDDHDGEQRTSAGLPKRVPKAHLVPGSVTPLWPANTNIGHDSAPGSTGQPPAEHVNGVEPANASGRTADNLTNGTVANGTVANGTGINGTGTNGTVVNGAVANGRSAAAARGRLASYQQGVRRGKHALADGDQSQPPFEPAEQAWRL